MKQFTGVKKWLKLALIPLAGLLVACGGGGGGDTTGSSTDTTISGSVIAAPVNGATVLVKDRAGNTVAGPVTTASDGTYSIDIPNSSLSADLVFESSGGTFDDEATGLTGRAAGTLAAYIAGGSLSSGSAVHLTPASTIVHYMVTTHGKTLAEAETAFETAFGFAVDTGVAPADATNPPTGATTAELLAGLRAAAFSQLTMDLGLLATDQFVLLPGLAQDIASGNFDGQDTSGAVVLADSNATVLPADIQNRFTQAMVNFYGSTHDKTGLDNDEIGTLPFAKVALSNSYKIEYVPGMMDAMEGKTMFTLRILDRTDNTTPITGLSVSLMPMMYMPSDMMHGSPSGGCSESATAGEYNCTMYYIMPSTMMNGMSMGYWELMVMAAMGESVKFYPQVMMAMGDTVKAVLKGQSPDDMIPGMMGDENRKYYLFKDGLSGNTGNHTFNLFIAAKESMMNYPALYAGQVLNSGTTYELTATSVSVEVSTDASTWIAATDGGDGHWSATGITGLTDGTAGTLYVRLSVNAKQKTTDGLVSDGSNDYASFTVTP